MRRRDLGPLCVVLKYVYTNIGEKMLNNRRKYSEACKLKAVFEVETGELSKKGAARRYGCDPKNIRDWVRKYGNGRWMERLKELKEVSMDEKDLELEKLKIELRKAQVKMGLYERIFKIANDELGIDLKKNFSTAALVEKEEEPQLPNSVKRHK